MGSKKKSQTTGYKYYMGMHMVVCESADELLEVQVGDRTVWTGSAADSQIYINAPNVFGGDKREGGVLGFVDVMMGGAGQTQNSYLQSLLGAAIPAFRGVVSMVLRRVYIAANNPYAKPWAFRLRRADHGPLAWVAPIPGGANPASIVAECLTNTRWGMGYPDSFIGSTFYNAAFELQVNEQFYLNLIWTRQQPIEAFIQIVLDHIGGVLYQDRQTGQFELLLIRAVGVSNIETYTPANLLAVEEFQRAAWGETTNEISVVYTDAASFKPKTVTMQNLANIAAQGGVVSRKVEYPGITSAELAARVALRDLRAASTPLAKVRIRALRGSWDMIPGQVFRLEWPELKIHDLVLRVGSISYGTLEDGTITIEAVEDVFSLDAADGLTGDNDIVFVPPDLQPQSPTVSLAFEVPYWEVALNSSTADLAFIQPTDTYLAALAATASDTQLNWALYTGPDGSNLVKRSTDDYAPTLRLPAVLPQSAADLVALPYTDALDLEPVVVGDYGYLLGSGGEIAEAVAVLAIDLNLGTIGLARGVLDTVPVAHPAGTRLLIVNEFAAPEGITRAPSETVHVYIAPATGIAEGAPGAVQNGPAITLVGRQGRPYPPGNLTINGSAYPVDITGDLVLAWAHRDRVQQTGYIVHQDEANIGPEAGTTYSVVIRGETGAIIRTYSGIAGTSQTYPTATESTDSGLPGGRLNNQLMVEVSS